MRALLGYSVLPDAARDAALAILVACSIAVVKVLWGIGSRLARLEGELEGDRRRAGAPSEPRE